jgi:hypothetical protein
MAEEEVKPITLEELVCAYGCDYVFSQIVELSQHPTMFTDKDRWLDPMWGEFWKRHLEILAEKAKDTSAEFSALKALHGFGDKT